MLSRRQEVPGAVDPLRLYRYLRALNPAPYLFYLALDDLALVGSSPEVLVRVEGDEEEADDLAEAEAAPPVATEAPARPRVPLEVERILREEAQREAQARAEEASRPAERPATPLRSVAPDPTPVKRSDGRRYYRPEDLRLIAGLCQVLREEGLSIRGARRLIASDRGSKLRQIGARRLGEIRGEFQAAAAQDGAVHDPFTAGSAQQAGDDQPPSPAADWLGRLCASAAFLHRARASGTPLPPGIAPLRDRLRQARG